MTQKTKKITAQVLDFLKDSLPLIELIAILSMLGCGAGYASKIVSCSERNKANAWLELGKVLRIVPYDAQLVRRITKSNSPPIKEATAQKINGK